MIEFRKMLKTKVLEENKIMLLSKKEFIAYTSKSCMTHTQSVPYWFLELKFSVVYLFHFWFQISSWDWHLIRYDFLGLTSTTFTFLLVRLRLCLVVAFDCVTFFTEFIHFWAFGVSYGNWIDDFSLIFRVTICWYVVAYFLTFL